MTWLMNRFGPTPVQFAKFGLVGAIGMVADTAVLYFCLYVAGMGFYLARVFSYLAAATVTWALNRAFTFRGDHEGKLYHQWARFLVVNAFGGVVNYAVYAALIASGSPFTDHPVLAVAAGAISGLFFNFAGSRRLVFRRT